MVAPSPATRQRQQEISYSDLPHSDSEQDRLHHQLGSSSSSSGSSPPGNNKSSGGSAITPAVRRLALCAALNSVNLGYDLGVSTNAAPKIQAAFALSDGRIELFLGSLNFWSIFGALVSPLLTDRWGRRVAFGAAATGFIVGVGGTAAAQTFTQLMVARCIVGLGVGVGEAIDPMYIAEIAPSQARGEMVSWAEAGVALGVVLGFASSLLFYSVDNENEWRYMLGLGAVMPCVMLYLVAYVMPESPRWLVAKNQEIAARAVLERLYPPDYNVNAILDEMSQSLALERAASDEVGWRTLLCCPSPAVRRMLTVGIGMAIIQQACGIDAIMFFMSYIMKQAGVTSEIGQSVALIALGSVKLGFVFVGGKLFDSHGRRPLLFASLIGCAASLVVVSLTFLGNGKGISQVITVAALAVYLAFFSVGLGPGNWVVVSEVFSSSLRAKAMSLAILPNRITATIMASTFLSIAEALTWAGFFLVLACICIASAAFLFVFLPETKGKSLESMSVFFAEITGDQSILEVEEKVRETVGRDQTVLTDYESSNYSQLEIPAILEGGTLT